MAGSHGGGDLIAAIYDAVIEPSGWDEVVKRIVEATNSFSGNLVLQQADAGSLTALYNVDPVVADAYAQTYHKNDPLRTPAWSLAPGEVRACSYTQTDSFRASAYYDEFVRPQGWADLVVTGLARTPNAFALLALTRSPDAVWVEPAEWRLLETLAPHLQRAAAIHAPTCPDESNNATRWRGGRGRRFRRLSLDRGLPGRLRQPQGRGPRAAPNGLAV